MLIFFVLLSLVYFFFSQHWKETAIHSPSTVNKLTAILMKNRGHKKYKSHLQSMKIIESTSRIIQRASKMYLRSSPQCSSGVCMGFTTEMTISFAPEQSPGKNKSYISKQKVFLCLRRHGLMIPLWNISSKCWQYKE